MYEKKNYCSSNEMCIRDSKGAMPEHLLQKANMPLLKEYQDRAEGNIRYITISPEVEGLIDDIPAMKELGITVAIGHSGADYDTSWKAINNGAECCTHTFNAVSYTHLDVYKRQMYRCQRHCQTYRMSEKIWQVCRRCV